ncbi:MAG TPA: ATP-dependent DNA helicase [Candidatus Tumulicola sp.]|nr:ATP-dependent DNA helicase [Candidatus Tumulicola sp.]
MVEQRWADVSDEQQAVVEHPVNQPAIVDAGAGTGKTHTIIHRVAYLHQKDRCEAKNVLLLTFARKAAAELRRRVLELLGPAIDPPHCSTFHAFAASVLADHAYDLGVSPDSTVIEDLDARLEFLTAFDEVIYGVEADASAFPLRSAMREQFVRELFDVAQDLKEEAIDVETFRSHAIAATDAIQKIPFRSIQKRGKKGAPLKAEGTTTDDELAQEAEEARARVIAAAAVFARYYARLQQRHALTYADLLLLARKGIAENPRLAQELRGRYKHCIVDEYQDTDLAQHRFLQTLFGAGLECVTVVGDPRQSIFGFRGAVPDNVRTFAALPGCVPFALSENRRSRQEILDLAHEIIAPQTGDAQALRANRGGAGSPIVHVRSSWESATNPRPNAEANRRAQARFAASQIAALLESGRVAPREIAMLTRNKTNVQPFTAALLEAGVPFRLLGGAGFYETNEIRDALAWLRVLSDPLDGKALARLTASEACGLSDATLAELTQDLGSDQTGFARRILVDALSETLDEDTRERLTRLRHTVDAIEPFSGAGLDEALAAVLEHSGLARRYEALGDEQAVANLRKLERLALSFLERNREARASDFVRYINELAAIEFDDREADPPSDNAVSIMTVHAAKGLEWPYVFVIDVWPAGKPSSLIWRDPGSGALLCAEGQDGSLPFHVFAARAHPDADGCYNPAEGAAKLARDAEERRLFYVALTRARDELFILGGRLHYTDTNPRGTPHQFIREAEDWVANRGWPPDEPLPAAATRANLKASLPSFARNSTSEFRSELYTRAGARVATATVALPPLSFSTLQAFERCPRSVTYRTVLRLPDLSPPSEDVSGAKAPALQDEALQVPAEPTSLLAAGEFGRLVHRALERWARDRLQAAPARPPQAYLEEATADLNLHVKAADRKRASGAVHEAIAKLDGWRVIAAEAPFTLQVGDVVVTGFIDLIAADPAGNVTILDYKTGKAASAELQLGIYREAAHRVYSVDRAACAIGRFEKDTFTIETVDPLAFDEVVTRIQHIAAGMRAADVTPKPGDWCRSCAYRAAPCDAYLK